MHSAMVFGHVNVGKSTLLGHLLLKMGKIDGHELHKLEDIAKEKKRERSVFAYIMDAEEEQDSGNTYVYKTVDMEYQEKAYRFYDTPGHRVCVAQFIEAAQQNPGTGILIVSAESSELESSITSGLVEEYTIMCRCLGIKNLVVAINKMDKIGWDDYGAVTARVLEIVKPIGYNPTFIPCNAFTGHGLTERTEYYPEAPSLLETITRDPERPAVPASTTKASRCRARIKIFRKTLITKGWSAACHIGETVVEGQVIGLFKDGKSTLCVQTGEATVVLLFPKEIEFHEKQRIILRNCANNTTVAGGLIVQ